MLFSLFGRLRSTYFDDQAQQKRWIFDGICLFLEQADRLWEPVKDNIDQRFSLALKFSLEFLFTPFFTSFFTPLFTPLLQNFLIILCTAQCVVQHGKCPFQPFLLGYTLIFKC